MKSKFIIAILAVVMAVSSCNPLRIVINSTDSKGVRTVLTSNQHLMGDMRGSMEIAFGARVEKKDTILAILVTIDADSGHGLFNEGDQMKIRLGDDSTIELKNLYDKEYEEKERTEYSTRNRTQIDYAYAYDYYTGGIYVTPYMVNQIVPEVRRVKNSYSYALYLISKTQMQNIIKKGVKKLRVEIENEDLDMPDPSNVPELFGQMYDLLRSTLATNFVRSKF